MDDVAVLAIEGGKANALTSELLETVERMIDGFERGPDAAAVITGYDRYFSSGLALPHLIELERTAMREFIELFARVMTRVAACEKPIVAAINGHAIAGGCVLALACDWRIAADEPALRIGLNEAQLGIGLPPIVVELLRAAVPPASIVPIAIEGALVGPRDALALGLVHAVAPAGELIAQATARAARLAALPAPAIAQIKHALRAPLIDAAARVADVEHARWLDTWFAPGAQARLRAAVARLGGAAQSAGTPPAEPQPPRSVSQPLPRFRRP